jgi:hypothetical protein
MEKGYYDPFTMGIRQKDINNALGPGNKQTNSVAGAAGAGYVIGDDEEDPGILAEGGVAEEDGRVFSPVPSTREIIRDIPGLIGGAVSDVAGRVIGGLNTVANAGGSVAAHEMGYLDQPLSLEELQSRSDEVQGLFPSVSEDNAAMRGLEEFFMNNPGAMQALAKFLGMYESGVDVADRYGPEAGTAARAIPQAAMELF